MAEEKVEIVKRLIPIFHHAASEYTSRAMPLADHLSGGIDKSLGSLQKMIEAIEGYLALAPPVAPRVEAGGPGDGPEMASARVGGSPPGTGPERGEVQNADGPAQDEAHDAPATRITHGTGNPIESGVELMSAHSARLQHALKDLREKWDITARVLG